MKNFFRDLVLPEMDRLVSSPEHMKMFKKASKDACCSSSCKCDESCTCEKCDKDCSKCDLGKVASSQDIVTNLLSLSETLESRNLVKSNALLLDFVDGMVSVAQCGDDSNDIQALDVLRGPTTEDFIGEEIRPLEEELDELESSPGYEDLDQILKDPELSKMFGEIRGKNQLDKEMANFTTSLSDIIDEDDDMEDAEKYIDNMNAKDHKWRKAEKILRIDSALFDDLSDSEKEIIEFSNKHIKNNVNVSKEELHFINENNYVENLKNTINKLNEIVESDLQPVESLIIHKILIKQNNKK